MKELLGLLRGLWIDGLHKTCDGLDIDRHAESIGPDLLGYQVGASLRRIAEISVC